MTQKIQLKVATPADASAIWTILSAAIQRRKTEGSNQWQDGYPNEQVIANDNCQRLWLCTCRRRRK